MKAGDRLVWWREGARPKGVIYVGVASDGRVVVEVGKRTIPVPLGELWVRAE